MRKSRQSNWDHHIFPAGEKSLKPRFSLVGGFNPFEKY